MEKLRWDWKKTTTATHTHILLIIKFWTIAAGIYNVLITQFVWRIRIYHICLDSFEQKGIHSFRLISVSLCDGNQRMKDIREKKRCIYGAFANTALSHEFTWTHSWRHICAHLYHLQMPLFAASEKKLTQILASDFAREKIAISKRFAIFF